MSDVSSRRETRRKRILENSTSRLQRIANVNRENANLPSSTDDSHVHDPLPTKSHAENHLVDDEHELTTLFERQATTSHTSSVNVTFNTSRRRLYCLIFLALVAKVMNYVCTPSKFFVPLTQLDVRTVCVESVFVPVLLYEIFNLLLFRSLDSEYSIVHSLLIIGKLSLKAASRISYALNVTVRVIQDLMVYFFLFTAMDLCVHVARKRTVF